MSGFRIDDFRFGTIVINGREYNADLIIYPDRVETVWWQQRHRIGPADLDGVLAARPEVAVVGTGTSGLMELLPEARRLLEEKGVAVHVDLTAAACRLYNELSPRYRTVALLHLTC
ncbi:MAG: hypothetical protein H5T97_12835 [Firmicutes bacterium]|nr:hypothetical protein [Bacillota bacterium]